jgi:tripartite-type tricarboxylate transporter receptor subunit TctC
VLPNLRQTAYDPMKDLLPVARVGDLVCGFVIHPSVGVKTFAEMLDYAKKNPGKLNYGSAGLGTGAHLRIEMLKYKTGVDITHIPYRGSADALNDLLPGNVQMMNEINVLPHVKAGKLILLNINYPARSPDWPDTPTLTELGVKDADEPIWYSIFTPAGTPQPIIDKFNAKCIEIAKTDDMQKRMREISVVVPSQSPAEMTAFMKKDFAANGELCKAANVKLE